MTIERHTMSFYMKALLIGCVIALALAGVEFNDYQSVDKSEEIKRLRAEKASKELQVEEIERGIAALAQKKEQIREAMADPREVRAYLTTYLNRLNTLGINRGLFNAAVKTVRPHPEFVNLANVELSIVYPKRTPAPDEANAISAAMFADIVKKDPILFSALRSLDGNLEVIGNTVMYQYRRKEPM